jgi:hypothetical protein
MMILFLFVQNDDVADRPSYQALVDPLQSDESSESKQESIAAPPPPSASQHREQVSMPQNSVPMQNQFDQSTPIQIKLPLQLDFDDLAGVSIRYNHSENLFAVKYCIQDEAS